MIDEHSSIAEKFLKKWFWLYLFSFFVAPIWYIIKIIISWDLRVEDIWIIYWVMSLMVFLSSLNDFWLTESMNRFIPEYVTNKEFDKVKSIIFYSFLIQSITWILIFILFFFWAEYLSIHYLSEPTSKEIIQIFAFFFLWYNTFQVINTFFQAVQDTFYLKITEFFRMLFILWFVFCIFLFDLWNIVSYSYSWVLWLFVWVIVSIIIFYFKYYSIYLKWKKIIFEKDFFLWIFKYAIIAFLWVQATTILSQIDMQMIIFLLWVRDAWYYTNYLSIIWIPFVIIWPIFWFLFPVFSEMSAKNEIEKIKLVKTIMVKFSLSAALAFNILFFVYAREISYILFWEKFLTSWVILQYSILFLVFNFLLQINFNIFSAIWKVTDRLKIILWAILFNVILNFVLIKFIWVYWAALATWCWWVLIYILSEIKLKDFRIKFDYKYFLKNLIWLWVFWIILKFLPINLLDFERLNSFFMLFLISILYFIVFVFINISDFKYISFEIKKLKWKK